MGLICSPIRIGILMTIDPDGRDLLLSCGAALHHLVVALAGWGWSAQVDRFPDPENSHHLARVWPSTRSPSAGPVALARAIPLRRTDRRRFSAQPVEQVLLETLIGHAAACGTELHVVGGGCCPRAADCGDHSIRELAAPAGGLCGGAGAVDRAVHRGG